MKLEDYQKLKEELEKIKSKNQEEINDYEEKINLANQNQFETKACLTFLIAELYYMGIIMTSLFFPNNSFIIPLTNILPNASIPFIITGLSLGMGIMGTKIMHKIQKIKERFISFSNAKTESEKLEEEIKYKIESEKLNKKNKAINESINQLDTNQAILNSLSDKYDIKEKNIPQTKEEIENLVENFSKLLKEKYEELNILVTQNVLNKSFYTTRNKNSRIQDIIIFSLIGGVIAILCYMCPLLVQLIANTLTRSYIIPSIASIFIGTIGFGGYMKKRNKNYQKVFHNLNQTLGENALPDEIKDTYEEKQEINSKIETIVNEISVVILNLLEYQKKLESFTNDNSEHTLEKSLSNTQTIETERIVTEEYTEPIAPEVEEKGKVLVMKKPYKPNDKKQIL